MLWGARGGSKGDLASATCEKDGIRLLAVNQNDHNQQQRFQRCRSIQLRSPRETTGPAFSSISSHPSSLKAETSLILQISFDPYVRQN
eukprot:g7998.t1